MSISDFSLSYQKSPIALSGGIAGIPGGTLPIISITQAIDFDQGVLSGAEGLDLNRFFFDFQPLPGGTLIENQVGTYPFANQNVAANAVIGQPLRISLLMVAPARGDTGGFDAKKATFQTLQSSLQQHIALGGTFVVATPAFIYMNCLLLSLRDITNGDPKQVQAAWQWDFFKPLLTLEEAQAAQNSLMSKMSASAVVQPNADGEVTYSGPAAAVGNPASLQAPSIVPAASGLQSVSVGSLIKDRVTEQLQSVAGQQINNLQGFTGSAVNRVLSSAQLNQFPGLSTAVIDGALNRINV